MSYHAKGTRLYLRQRSGNRSARWVIRDGAKETSTGCGPGDYQAAERKLAIYIGQKYEPRAGEGDPRKVLVSDILNLYAQAIAANPEIKRKDVILYTISSLLGFWAEEYVSDIKRSTCQAYVKWRTGQTLNSITKRTTKKRKVAPATARRDLETLRAAVNHYHAESPLLAVPVVTLPSRSPSRVRWLTRSEAAALLWAAWRSRRRRHMARAILIGLYTGTRPGAVLALHWHTSPVGGWFDLESGVLHRRGLLEGETKKRRPPSRIPDKLLPHLRRWQAKDAAKGINLVVHFYGRPIARPKTAWNALRTRAGLGREVTPHVLRHTAATWQMQSGTKLWEAAGYLGMSVEVLETIYGHHHPDFQKEAANAY